MTSIITSVFITNIILGYYYYWCDCFYCCNCNSLPK